MRRLLIALTGLCLALAASAPAGVRAPSPTTPAAVTATTFLVSGRGWGHGVGMSQYGALGYAQEGWTHEQILAHYYAGAEARPVAGRARPRARRRGEGQRDRPFLGAVPCSRRLRQDVSAAGGRGHARPEAARDRQRRRRPSSPGRSSSSRDGAARGRPALPGPDRGLGHRREARRGQRRRARAVPPGRRRAGDAEQLAGGGTEGAGGRGTLVRALAPAHRQAVRPLRRRAQPGLRRDPRRASATTAAVQATKGQVLLWEGSRSTRSSTRPRAGRRSTQRRSSGSPCPISSASTTPQRASPVHRWGPTPVAETALRKGLELRVPVTALQARRAARRAVSSAPRR